MIVILRAPTVPIDSTKDIVTSAVDILKIFSVVLADDLWIRWE